MQGINVRQNVTRFLSFAAIGAIVGAFAFPVLVAIVILLLSALRLDTFISTDRLMDIVPSLPRNGLFIGAIGGILLALRKKNTGGTP